jgi:hypothetical protein
LFLNAEPQKTGVIFWAIGPSRSAALSSRLEGLAGEVLLEQLVVLFGDRLDHLLAEVLGFRASSAGSLRCRTSRRGSRP